MESQISNYRLERWIALFLSLLFLLPFVAQAQAQEIALVCSDNSAWLEPNGATTPAHAWVLPAKHLEAGPVTTATCNDVPQPTPARIAFNGAQSTLHWRCNPSSVEGFKQCALLLDEQVLTWRMALDDQEMRVLVSFAGDADRDGRLDLLLDISRNGSEWHPALFLSSAAKKGQLVAKVAEAVVTTPEL
ncbi:MAG TPA: hypothetical protein VHK90_15060 [Thermoanaerobaculia bacterium]|nr:hypothetical protein [Thermoanaerobaculia bacterium]